LSPIVGIRGDGQGFTFFTPAVHARGDTLRAARCARAVRAPLIPPERFRRAARLPHLHADIPDSVRTASTGSTRSVSAVIFAPLTARRHQLMDEAVARTCAPRGLRGRADGQHALVRLPAAVRCSLPGARSGPNGCRKRVPVRVSPYTFSKFRVCTHGRSMRCYNHRL
jgi:hypothetical protein